MATSRKGLNRETVARAGVVFVLSTLLLTANFLGVVALATGSVDGFAARLPFYVLAMAIAFVGSIIILEGELHRGPQILQMAAATAAGSFLLVMLGGEGFAFIVQKPGQVLSSQLLFYFLAAGLIGTGLGYWGVRHWHDITESAGL
ncbi:MAG: hypothetical protein ACI8XM_000593 [Haloarculaceae archaeon]|jgi:hypothetical protein